MNSEKEILKKRFLDGETTLDDERRLRALLDGAEDDEERALRMILGNPLAGGTCSDEDFEAWIAEDFSEEYDAIVAGRRRQTMTRVAAWIAAAVIGRGCVFGNADALGQQTRRQRQRTAAYGTLCKQGCEWKEIGKQLWLSSRNRNGTGGSEARGIARRQKGSKENARYGQGDNGRRERCRHD